MIDIVAVGNKYDDDDPQRLDNAIDENESVIDHMAE